MAKKFMFVNRRAPYGTIYALESLEVVLISAAFEQEVALVFMDDGEAERNGKDATNIHPAFRISGLGQLIEAAIESDRLMVFGD
jgi:sulfur relay (sulfurtransferase) complex TusBCD TusD component (DsrE family)